MDYLREARWLLQHGALHSRRCRWSLLLDGRCWLLTALWWLLGGGLRGDGGGRSGQPAHAQAAR